MIGYKAQELYPMSYDRWERMMLTVSAKRRLRKFWSYEGRPNLREISELIGVSRSCLYFWRTNPRQVMPLPAYLQIMELSGQELTERDINYAYAEVIYPPEDIERRILRLKVAPTYWSSLKVISTAVQMDITGVWRAVTYNYNRTLWSYAKVMKWISVREQERGYDDALRFEE